jgi:hypothetical protein
MGAVPISLQNRVAVEAAYMVEALTSVRSMRLLMVFILRRAMS